MFDAVKSVISIVGIVMVTYLAMSYFGYEINSEYFTYSKKECQRKIRECANQLIHDGLDKTKCNFKCIDPDIIIKKK